MANTDDLVAAKRNGRLVICSKCGQERLDIEMEILKAPRLGIDEKICVLCKAETYGLVGKRKSKAAMSKEAKKLLKEEADAEEARLADEAEAAEEARLAHEAQAEASGKGRSSKKARPAPAGKGKGKSSKRK